MKIAIAATVLLTSAIICSAQKCGCSPAPNERTYWVGNLHPILIRRGPYRQVRGTITRPDGTPFPNALVEVFTKPEYLLIDKPVPKQGRPNQRRLRACRTGPDGKFCFVGLRAGRYEVRSSSDDTRTGWNASSAYVIVNSKGRRSSRLKIEMSLGI